MKVLLVEPHVKSIAPNVALMKLARWCELKGHDYQYIHGMLEPKITPDVIYTSCIFSYNSEKYKKIFEYYKRLFPGVQIIAGGGFPTVCPEWFREQGVYPYQGLSPNFEELIPKYNVPITYHKKKKPYVRDKIILYSSKGCGNSCSYCLVPKLEGGMKCYKSISNTLRTASDELPDAKSVVLYDNNLTLHTGFDAIMDELRDFGLPIDVYGLHVDAFAAKHAKKLAQVQWASQSSNGGTPYVRFSFDRLSYARHVERAFKLVRKYEIQGKFFCYLLYNYKDSPDDFWHRIVTAQEIRDRVGGIIYLFPQRFIPLDSLTKTEYVSPKWTPEMLHGLAKLYTYIHGFLSITESRNLFNWIGQDKKSFFKNIKHMHNHNTIEKKSR